MIRQEEGRSILSSEGERVEQGNSYSRQHADAEGESLWRDESGIIVFGGGGRGCSGTGCLIWIVISVALSVGLTVLLNLMLWLFSGSPPGIPMVDI